MRYKLDNPPKELCEKDAKWLEKNNIVVLEDNMAIWILNSEMVDRIKKEGTRVL